MRISLIIFLLTMGLGLRAQELESVKHIQGSQPLSQFMVDNWNTDDGLPTNAILDMEKSPDGFMWLATFNGLVRFDGVDFKTFNKNNTPQFQTNNISALYRDQNGILWIGTNGGGLVRMKNGIFQSYQPTSFVRNTAITALEQGNNGSLWVGTRLGLALIENDSLQKVDFAPLSTINVTSLHLDHKQRLWVGSAAKGLFVIESGTVHRFNRENLGLSSNFIRSIFHDSQDRIWVGTDRGVAVIDESGIRELDSVQLAPQIFTNAIIEDHLGNIWMGSNDGLRRFNDQFEALEKTLGMDSHIVQSLYQDEEKNIWVGTYRGGLLRLKQSKFLNLGRLEGLANEVINAVYEDDSVVWIGSDDGLASFRNGIFENYQLGRRSAGNRIRDILRDSRGRLWLCTYYGLVQFESGRTLRRITTVQGLSSNNTRRIVEDSKGNLWVGTANGLNRISDEGVKSFGLESGLGDLFVMSLFIDRQDQLWVGTDGGGAYLKQGTEFTPAFSEESGHDIIFNIAQDYNGAYWLSSNRGIIYRSDSIQYNLTQEQGLISNNIFQTIIDETGQIWITSDRGLMRTNRNELMEVITGRSEALENYRIFDRSDGLRTSQITAASKSIQTAGGNLWIATLNGVTVINSRQIPINEVLPQTAITMTRVDDQDWGVDSVISLPAGIRRTEFHYTGLSFYSPEKVRFKYMLENFDDDWIEAQGRRVAYYTNIPPGSYEFKVLAANNDGIWNMDPAIIKVQQQAYFYQTKGFYVLLALLLIALGAFLYWLRVRGFKRRNKILARLVKERTRSIREQNHAIINQKEELKQLNLVKDKLLSVISHDLRGPIAAVAGLLGLLKSGHLNYKELMAQSSSLNNEVHGLTYLLDNLLSWSKSQMQGINLQKENHSLKQVIEENIRVIVPMSEHKNITINNKVPDNCVVYTDANLLSIVIRNLIMNAIKFTPGSGKIEISANSSSKNVTVSVQDNGVGIPATELSVLFDVQNHYSKMGTANEAGSGIGLLLCQEFLEMDGGKIWAESQEGVGSSFYFTLTKAVNVSADL